MGSSRVNRTYSLASVTGRWMERAAHGIKGTVTLQEQGMEKKRLKDRDLEKNLQQRRFLASTGSAVGFVVAR